MHINIYCPILESSLQKYWQVVPIKSHKDTSLGVSLNTLISHKGMGIQQSYSSHLGLSGRPLNTEIPNCVRFELNAAVVIIKKVTWWKNRVADSLKGFPSYRNISVGPKIIRGESKMAVSNFLKNFFARHVRELKNRWIPMATRCCSNETHR